MRSESIDEWNENVETKSENADTESVKGNNGGMTPWETPLPDGYIDEKIQVDRKKLECMITGISSSYDELPSASEFFSKVENATNTQISWPSRLKIGAKTKKDPFVKIIGIPESVAKAKESISNLLRVKKDRITLKMEIGHTSHSHIIGRGGRNTQDVMRETNCHIHFPDSNKHNDIEKNNQVSIAGGIGQVERARSKLRLISPINLNISLELNQKVSINLMDLQRSLTSSEISVQISMISASTIQMIIKGSIQYEELILATIEQFHRYLSGLGFSTDASICRSSFDLRPALLQSNYGLFGLNTIRWIAFHTKTQMQFSPQGSSILVMGSAVSIFSARRYLTGLLPVSIQFEKPNEATSKQSLRNYETKFDVTIGEKKKANGNSSNEVMIVIRSYEANISNIYAARQQILQSEISEALPVNEYSFMRNFLNKIKESSNSKSNKNYYSSSQSLLDIHHSPPRRSTSFSECHSTPNFLIGKSCFDAFSSERSSPVFPELCSGRDPRDAFIADGRGVVNNSDFWKAPGLERQIAINRDKMLLKANKGIKIFD
jgi:protein bicaudal C